MNKDQLTDNSTLTEIYLQISTNSTFDNFDNSELNEMLEDVVTKIYNKDFQRIDTNELQRNTVLLNNSFVKLHNACKKEYNVDVHLGFLFIFYVDYFSLDYALTYNAFHPNIQRIVEFYFKKKIGNDSYERLKKKYTSDDTTIKSLFDL